MPSRFLPRTARGLAAASLLVVVALLTIACEYGVNPATPDATTTSTTSSVTSTTGGTTTTGTTTGTTSSTGSTGSTGTTGSTTSTSATLTYVKDIAPIMAADCVTCHGTSRRDAGYNFTTYAGVMAAVSSTTANCKLVRSTQAGGVMYSQFKSNAATKAKTIYDWVVTYKAAQQ